MEFVQAFRDFKIKLATQACKKGNFIVFLVIIESKNISFKGL